MLFKGNDLEQFKAVFANCLLDSGVFLNSVIGKDGDRASTRTRDLLLRRQLLYPAELRDHGDHV